MISADGAQLRFHRHQKETPVTPRPVSSKLSTMLASTGYATSTKTPGNVADETFGRIGLDLTDDAGGGAGAPGVDQVGLRCFDFGDNRRGVFAVEVQVAHGHLKGDAALFEIIAKPILDLGLAAPHHGENFERLGGGMSFPHRPRRTRRPRGPPTSRPRPRARERCA